MTFEEEVLTVMATLAGIALLVRASRKSEEPSPTIVEPPMPPLPTPPTPPAGWTHLLQSEVTPELQTKAIEFLRSTAPIGSMNPFELGGQQFGAFLTFHGKKRAVELFRPLV